MTAAAPQCVRRGRKYEQVLAGARAIFLRDGYERASVDDIAREAGVSKATLYAYFPDKGLLFMEMARSECARRAQEAMAMVDDQATLRDVLLRSGERILAFVCSDLGQRVFRICVAEGPRFPELAQVFYRSGPKTIRDTLASYLRTAAARGEIRPADFDLAADQFIQLCKANVHDRLIFGTADALSDADRHRTVEGAVEMFMSHYGRPG